MPKNHDATAAHKAVSLYALLLFTGKRHYLADLAARLGCSKPTVMRLMETIEASEAAEIETGLEGRRRWYQLKNLPGTPYIGLTVAEMEKLTLCRDLLERLLPEGVERAISETLTKVSTLIDRPTERGKATAPKASRVSWGRIDYTPFQGTIEFMLKAIAEHGVCEVEYREVEHLFDEREVRRLEFVPVRLAAENEVLNIEGWWVTDKGAPQVKHPLTLAVHRILSFIPTRRTFPDCPALPEYKGAFGLVGYEPFPVRVLFGGPYVNYVRERIWSERQEIIDLPSGEIELHFEASGIDELIRWVLSFGCWAELLEPEHLRAQIFEEIEDLWSYYAPEEEEEEEGEVSRGDGKDDGEDASNDESPAIDPEGRLESGEN